MQPFHGSLGTHLGHAGYVVHGVTHQGLVVQHQARGHAKLLLHPRQIAAFAVHGIDDGDVLVDQLRQILIATADDHFNALVGRDYGQRADHVIRLNTGHVKHGPAQQAHDFVDGRDLAAQVVRHRGAIGFVFGVDGVPKRRAFGIKHAGHVIRRHFFAQALHHVDHDADRTGLLHGTVG